MVDKWRSFGFNDAGTAVVGDEAKWIRAAAQAVAAGGSAALSEQVKEWNEDGRLTTAGNPWSVTTMQRLLLNPKLTEKLGRWQVLTEDVQKQITEALAVKPTRRGRPRGSSGTLLGGGALVCPNCAAPFEADADHGVPIYSCPQGQPQPTGSLSCGKVSIDRSRADEAVVERSLSEIAAHGLPSVADPGELEQLRQALREAVDEDEAFKARVRAGEFRAAPGDDDGAVSAKVTEARKLRNRATRRVQSAQAALEKYESRGVIPAPPGRAVRAGAEDGPGIAQGVRLQRWWDGLGMGERQRLVTALWEPIVVVAKVYKDTEGRLVLRRRSSS